MLSRNDLSKFGTSVRCAEGGSSLVEVLVAVALLSSVLLPLAVALVTSVGQQRAAHFQQALMASTSFLETGREESSSFCAYTTEHSSAGLVRRAECRGPRANLLLQLDRLVAEDQSGVIVSIPAH